MSFSTVGVFGLKKPIRLLWPFSDPFLELLGTVFIELALFRLDGLVGGAASLPFACEIEEEIDDVGVAVRDIVDCCDSSTLVEEFSAIIVGEGEVAASETTFMSSSFAPFSVVDIALMLLLTCSEGFLVNISRILRRRSNSGMSFADAGRRSF